jgi:hypothetical protein
MERDPALLPGPTAQQWEVRARVVLAAGAFVLLVDVVLLAARAPVHPSILIALGIAAFAGFVGWLVLGVFALRRQRDEMRAGYSTTVDAAGYDLRHPVTGALERDRTEPPVERPRRRSFLMDNFRIRSDTWMERRNDPDGD